MKDPLPVPDQLEKQLAKCKTVRDADTYCKSREKTNEVRVNGSFCLFIIVVCAHVNIVFGGGRDYVRTE